MKKNLTLISVALLIAISSVTVGLNNNASAAYDKSYIIDDIVFENENSMTEAEINSLINRYPSSCLLAPNYPSNISTSAFKTPIDYWNYSDTNSTPAQIILWSAKHYHLSPQVIMTTLEKEQNLITGASGCGAWRYNSAMGYDCPDNLTLHDYPELGIYTTCVQRIGNAGFSRQVSHAAWQLRFNDERADGNVDFGGDGSATYSGYMTKGYRARVAGGPLIYYDGYAVIDGVSTYISNGATASLYSYTPHSNSNFYSIFTNWFGDPRLVIVTPVAERYNANTWLGKPLINQVCTLKDSGCYQLFANGSIYWSSATGAQILRGGIKDKWVISGFENGALGYPTSGEIPSGTGVYQTFQGGRIYWSANAGAVKFTNELYAAWTTYGAETGFFGKPVTDTICGLKDNGCYQLFKTGTIYWSAATGAQVVHGGIKSKWISAGFENGPLGYPTSGEIPSGTGVYQTFQGGRINWDSTSGASIVYN